MIRCLLILTLLSPFTAKAQINLVPNGDFESITDAEFPCSWLVDDHNINNFVNDWYTPIATTTDVMSSYANDDCWAHTPNTGEGYMAPHSGNVMIGFINYSPDGGCQPNEWHEYLTVELTEALTPGNVYCVEFWVALGSYSAYATNNIGALLTTRGPDRTSCDPIFNKPQVNVTHVLKNTHNWLRIEASFLADSAYRFLTIGNFFSHEETIIEEQKAQPAQQPQGTTPSESEGEDIITDEVESEYNSNISYLAYYFIDDVKLYLCPSVRLENTNDNSTTQH